MNSRSSSTDGKYSNDLLCIRSADHLKYDSAIQPYWFVIFELVYIVIFVVISVAIHLFGWLKTDEDTVTIHHKIHKEVIAQQERRFMSQKKENFIRTGKRTR